MRRALLLLPALALVAVSCGGDDGSESSVDLATSEVVPVADRARPAPDDDPTIAGAPMLDLGVDLLAELPADEPNTLLSPASIAIALAMVEPGAVGDAQAQLRDLLGITDATPFHAAMNALEQSLEARQPTDTGDGEPGELVARIANGAYLQQGFPFEAAYLDSIGRHYGPVLNEVDYRADPDAVAHRINTDVAEATEDHITDLIPDGALHVDSVLTLVNALYLRASWLGAFEAADTEEDGTFTTPNGEVTVPLMHGASDGSARGDGWVAASKDLTGGLVAQFVLPDDGRFDEVGGRLREVFADLSGQEAGAELVVPRFETRAQPALTPALQALGLTAPYEPGHLLGIADDDRLVVEDVVHQAWLAMDEEGIEAAAATAVLIGIVSAPIGEPVPVVLDRPFFFRILDQQTGATLFLGRVTDPTA